MLHSIEPPPQDLSTFVPNDAVAVEFRRATHHLKNRLVGFTSPEIKMLLLAAASPQCTRILLVGQHGTGKSTAARELGLLFNAKTAIYNAAVDDLISLAGVPDTKRFGSLSQQEAYIPFQTHSRCGWDKDFWHVDELNRAGPETQNLYLEPLSELTLFGQPLPAKLFIATVNPAADRRYSGTFRLDDALRDRFDLVINVRASKSLSIPELTEVARVNLGPGGPSNQRPSMQHLPGELANRRQQLLEHQDTVDAVAKWCGRVTRALMDADTHLVISQRSVAQFSRITIESLALESLISPLSSEILTETLHRSAQLCLATKFELSEETFQAGVRGQGVAMILKSMITPRRADLIAVGGDEERLEALGNIQPDDLGDDAIQVRLAAEKLLNDLSRDPLKVHEFLRRIPPSLPQVCLQAELESLQHRLETLRSLMAMSMSRLRMDKVCRRTRAYLSEERVWAPRSTVWSVSRFRRLRRSGADVQLDALKNPAYQLQRSMMKPTGRLPDLEPRLLLIATGDWALDISRLLTPLFPKELADVFPYLEAIQVSQLTTPDTPRFMIVGCRPYANGYAATRQPLGGILDEAGMWRDNVRRIFAIPRTALPTFFEIAQTVDASHDRLLRPTEPVEHRVESFAANRAPQPIKPPRGLFDDNHD